MGKRCFCHIFICNVLFLVGIFITEIIKITHTHTHNMSVINGKALNVFGYTHILCIFFYLLSILFSIAWVFFFFSSCFFFTLIASLRIVELSQCILNAFVSFDRWSSCIYLQCPAKNKSRVNTRVSFGVHMRESFAVWNACHGSRQIKIKGIVRMRTRMRNYNARKSTANLLI